jgi:hypothetical protein
MSTPTFKAALSQIFTGISSLQKEYPNRRFTIDGRLVGDIGEIVAALEFDIELDAISQPLHDGTTSDGRRVQVKATFQDHLTFTKTPDFLLGLKLSPDGSYEVIFNGPGIVIFDAFAHRKSISEKLLRFSNKRLLELSQNVPNALRIPRRVSR